MFFKLIIVSFGGMLKTHLEESDNWLFQWIANPSRCKKPLVGSSPTSSAMENKEQVHNLREYQELCKKTAVKFDEKEKEILAWGLGISGEAGDVAGCIKKTFYHDNDQRGGIRENLGDTMWYIAMICNYFNWDFEKVLGENIEKLEKRYPQGFTEKDAGRSKTRIDWNEKR